MTYDYFVHEKTTGRTDRIRRGKEAEFFTALESITGLDRPFAEPLLHSGRHIEHPEYDVYAKPVNPFDPARLV